MKRSHMVLVGLGILVVAGYFVYKEKSVIRSEKKRSEALELERNELWDRIGTLEKNVAELEQELSLHKETLVPQEKLDEVFGEKSNAPIPRETELDCQELQNRMTDVFSYLDKKEYLPKYGLSDTNMYTFASTIASELLIRPPLVTGEMKDMVSLARNVAHFYRVLGEKRIALLRDVMNNESEIIESFMAVSFPWWMSCPYCEPVGVTCPSLETLYQYAGFFLNTLAGKSYLMRRASKLRVLVGYYSVLVLDKANSEMLNPHGIDIRPFIDSLTNEIRNQRGLVHKKQYLDVLSDLKNRYRM